MPHFGKHWPEVMLYQKGVLLLECPPCFHLSAGPASSLYLPPERPKEALHVPAGLSLTSQDSLYPVRSRPSFSTSSQGHPLVLVYPTHVLLSSQTGPVTVHSFIQQFIEFCQLVWCSRYWGRGPLTTLWVLGTFAIMGRFLHKKIQT